MKIRMIGDHSDYHCGSAAAFQAICAEVRRHGRIVDVDDSNYDLLVVNGEGSMHHDSKLCRDKISHIQNALDTGRRAVLINTVWQDNSRKYAELLVRCDHVVAREVCSAYELANIGIQAEVKMDLAFSCEIEDVEPIDFNGAVLVTDFYSKEFGTFARLTGKWAEKFVYIDLREWTWSRLVRSMASASLLITGRHHAVYAACKARLPFLAMEGNTHKISGLIQTAGSNVPVFHNFSDLKSNILWPRKNYSSYNDLFHWMHRQSPWQLVN